MALTIRGRATRADTRIHSYTVLLGPDERRDTPEIERYEVWVFPQRDDGRLLIIFPHPHDRSPEEEFQTAHYVEQPGWWESRSLRELVVAMVGSFRLRALHPLETGQPQPGQLSGPRTVWQRLRERRDDEP